MDRFKITRALSFNGDMTAMYQDYKFYEKGKLVVHLRKEYTETMMEEALYFIKVYGKLTPEEPFQERTSDDKRLFKSEITDLLRNHGFVKMPN